MVKNPLQANNKTAKIRWMMAGSGKRPSFSKMGWMEELLIDRDNLLGMPINLFDGRETAYRRGKRADDVLGI